MSFVPIVPFVLRLKRIVGNKSRRHFLWVSAPSVHHR